MATAVAPVASTTELAATAPGVEGQAAVLMEAMACEIPSVAPHITAIPELIEEGVTGLTATAGRADHLAAALERYATDPSFAAGVGKAAREKILDEFTTAGTVAGMVDFFDRTLPAAPGPVTPGAAG